MSKKQGDKSGTLPGTGNDEGTEYQKSRETNPGTLPEGCLGNDDGTERQKSRGTSPEPYPEPGMMMEQNAKRV